MVEIKTAGEVQAMRAAGQVVARILAAARAEAKAGMALTELDEIARGVLAEAGATSPFLGYQPGFAPIPFPAVICTSVNDAALHGIPTRYRLAAGDLLSVDCGAVLDGWAGDAAISFTIGARDYDVPVPMTLLALKHAWPFIDGMPAAKNGIETAEQICGVGPVGPVRLVGHGDKRADVDRVAQHVAAPLREPGMRTGQRREHRVVERMRHWCSPPISCYPRSELFSSICPVCGVRNCTSRTWWTRAGGPWLSGWRDLRSVLWGSRSGRWW